MKNGKKPDQLMKQVIKKIASLSKKRDKIFRQFPEEGIVG